VLPQPCLARALSPAFLLAAALAAGCTIAPAAAGPEPRSARARQTIDGGSSMEQAKTRAAPRSAPKLPPSPRRACRQDRDCAFWTRPCSCPPCGKVWREVVNRKELARLQSAWARRRCARPVCDPCEGEYLGTKPICVAGQCTTK
jgi:hypothetical protein